MIALPAGGPSVTLPPPRGDFTMRVLGAGFGLLSLLVVVGIIIYVFAAVEIPKAKAGKAAQERVRPIAGYGKDDVPATESFAAEGLSRNSRFSGLKVTSVTPGGAMDTYYGLLVSDEIVAVGGTPIDALANGDEQLAKAVVVSEGFQRQQPITVRRGGAPTELRFDATASAGGGAGGTGGTAGQAPAVPDGAGNDNSLQRQLESIQNAAGR
jgi:hypothetical protein